MQLLYARPVCVQFSELIQWRPDATAIVSGSNSNVDRA